MDRDEKALGLMKNLVKVNEPSEQEILSEKLARQLLENAGNLKLPLTFDNAKIRREQSRKDEQEIKDKVEQEHREQQMREMFKRKYGTP